ncbi:hypothetical protein [Granulicella sp. S156]|jgi:hypothetical protein|uniref:hypothetical protein n=1 Tax=Granulicella sp. S156 TaxID=1747224 RepID=UPI00131BD16B|nr:hypothetical protein [Granulicella sp. S156]
MSSHTPNVLEIDRKLRDDFRRRVKDFGVSTETTDPLLAVLFRTVAQQIDQIYSDTAQLRQSLLHELMSGLQVQQYLATPAQAAVRLINDLSEPRVLRAGTELNAVASTGERLSFGLDATFEVSQARIAFALSYQDQTLRLLTGVEMSDTIQAMRPSSDPVPVSLGPQPALYIAIENLSAGLLNRHSLFFELGPGTYPVQHALCHEPWWIFGEDGDLAGEGLLRPKRINGGVYQLEFQLGGNESVGMLDAPLPSIPNGFYTGRQYLFPPMHAGQPLLCRVPRLLEPALTRILNRDAGHLLSEPRLWIKIPMPPNIPALHHAINGILLHTMTASNVFARNQTIRFERDGISIPVVKEGGTPEYLVAPLTVMSVDNHAYEAATRPGADASAGRFELHNNRLTLYPGMHSNGTPHTAANIRLWLTNGALGNRVGPGDITSFANAAALTGIRLAPFTAASGGSDGEHIASKERRFADALLTRGRIVTRQDLETAAFAVDRRILDVITDSGMVRKDEGIRRVERLQLTLDSHAFSKPEIELPALKSQIEASLGARLVQGLELEVEFTWN